jgi:hypothetical protein
MQTIDSPALPQQSDSRPPFVPAHSRPRMHRVVHLRQALEIQGRVNLRRSDIGVAE